MRWIIIIICFAVHIKSIAQPISPELDPTTLKFNVQKGKNSYLTANDKEGNTWIKGHISPTLQQTSVVLQIPSMQFLDYDLYLSQGKNLVKVKGNVDLQGRPIQTRYPIHYFMAKDSVYYLNLKKQPIQGLWINIDDPGNFVKQANTHFIINSLYYGLIIMSIIFNVVLFLIFGDKRFWLYSLLQLCIFLIFFYQDGMFYFFSKGKWVNPHFLLWIIALCSIISTIFAYYFLDLKKRIPHFKRIAAFMIGAIFCVVTIYIWTDIKLFRNLASVFFYLFPAICIYHAIKMFRSDVYARFLILTFGFIALVSAFFTLNNYIDSTFLSYFGMDTIRFASTLEVIVISFAIIFKVRTLQQENERFREELDRYIYELEELRQSQSVSQNNGTTLPNSKKEQLNELKSRYGLTEREAEVLFCIVNRLTNQEISEKFNISLSTTKYHIGNLYVKLDVKNRKEIHQVLLDH